MSDLTMKSFRKNQYGLSLIELLVALVISTFLMGGVIQVYLGNKTAYRFADASSRIQENARFALDTITTDARLAGFFGCVDIRKNSNLVQNHLDTGSNNFDPLLYGFTSQPPVTLTANNGLNGSDSITIRGSKPGSASLSATLAMPGSGDIQISGTSNFKDHDIMLITNCWTSDIFEATTASSTTLTHSLGGASSTSPGNMAVNTQGCPGGEHCLNGTIASNLDSAYTANNSTVYALHSVTYSIKASGSGSGEPALFRSENGKDQELIEGIEQMQVFYGVDTDGDNAANQYVDSAAVIDQEAVTSIKVWLVARSENNNVLEKEQTYTINGVDTTAGDKRLRQVFSLTIDLRNR
jgi:type IV pilus assembly protein PilW